MKDSAIPEPSTALDAFNSSGRGQSSKNISFATFIASLSTALVIFGLELLAFFILKSRKGRFKQIYAPKTFLVPQHERLGTDLGGKFGWFKYLFTALDEELISKCGLDAFMFLRYLRMLIKIFVPLACVILPILVPINKRGRPTDDTSGLDTFGWQNMGTAHTDRFWVHLVLAVFVIIYVCWMFYYELQNYVRIRQAHLADPAHRIRASATTVLISNVPYMYLDTTVLEALFRHFPGGVRNIWINRNFDELSEKVKQRTKIARQLEAAELSLIKKCMERAEKRNNSPEKKDGASSSHTKLEHIEIEEQKKRQRSIVQNSDGLDAGNPFRRREREQQEQAEAEAEAAMSRSRSLRNKLLSTPKHVGRELGRTSHILTAGVAGRLKKTAGGLSGLFESPAAPPPRHLPGVDEETSPLPVDGAADTDDSTGPAPDQQWSDGQHTRPTTAHERAHSLPDNDRNLSDDEAPLRKYEPQPEPVSPTSHHPDPSETTVRRHRSSEDGGEAGTSEDGETTYPAAYDKEFDPQQNPKIDDDAVWRRYLDPKDRETMRKPLLDRSWCPSLPFIGEKVDTIYWCRTRLAQLNVEVERDQEEPENFLKMNSVFIQFNHQIAAHMACQSLIHHLPETMAPRVIEISPNDVIWDNLSIKWWQRMIRSFLVIATIAGIIIAWAFPTTFTGLLSQVSYLTAVFPWLGWIERLPKAAIAIIQGALPPLFLAILLALLPLILRLLAKFEGFPTGMLVELRVQNYYFAFLFIQIFLVVSIASGLGSTIERLVNDPLSVPQTLADNLPKASNYFFSYMILQALTVSAGALMQFGSLIQFFILAPLLDKTPRDKWNRRRQLPKVEWGTFFPVYTNLAAIGLVYSVVTPLILVFNIITFSLFWLVYRYQTLYVVRFEFDTGGLMFPRAINQLFTGLYVMELCLIGLFFLVRDETNRPACTAQAGIMIACLVLTVIYQVLLDKSFSPLFKYLPLTCDGVPPDKDGRDAETELGDAHHTDSAGVDNKPSVKAQLRMAARRSGLILAEAAKAKDFAARLNLLNKEEEEINRRMQADDQERVRMRRGRGSKSALSVGNGLGGGHVAAASGVSIGRNPDSGLAPVPSGRDRLGLSQTLSRPNMDDSISMSMSQSFQPDSNRRSVYLDRKLARSKVEVPRKLSQQACYDTDRRASMMEFEEHDDDDVEAEPDLEAQNGYKGTTAEEGPGTAETKQTTTLTRRWRKAVPKFMLPSPGSVEDDGDHATAETRAQHRQEREDLDRALGDILNTPRMVFPHQKPSQLNYMAPPTATDIGADADPDATIRALPPAPLQLQDMAPADRDELINWAFHHRDFRAIRPFVWLPQDPYGISDDEIKRTNRLAGENVWIGNCAATIDAKGEVRFRAPPLDYNNLDAVQL